MIAATVFNELVSTLNENPTLKEYIKHIFKGVRYEVEVDSLPCIMCEVTGNNEIDKNFNQIKKIWLDIDVYAYAYTPADPDYAIVGQKDHGYYGVLNIENDIRACLQSSYSLGDNVEDIRIEPTRFDQFEMGGTLMRRLVIPIRIKYRQTDGV